MPAAFAQTITGVTLSDNPVCPGQTITITFTRTGLAANTTETAFLSNASGSFASASNIGSAVGNASAGSISATIPPGTAAGTGYLIRISSSHVPGPVNSTSTPVTVAAPLGTLAFAAGLPTSLCKGVAPTSFTATAANNFTLTYAANGTPANPGITISTAGLLTVPAAYTGSIDIVATATGCGGPSTKTHTVVINDDVQAPVFTLGPVSTRCQGLAPLTQTYSATATNASGAITYSISPSAATTAFNTATGAVTFDATFSGNVVITASAPGCNGPATSTHTVTVSPAATALSFTAGPTSNLCQGATTNTYTATASNTTGAITYSISPAAAATAFDPATGATTFNAAFSGNATITATAPGCQGNITATHVVTIAPAATAPSFTLGATSARCQGVAPLTQTYTSQAGLKRGNKTMETILRDLEYFATLASLKGGYAYPFAELEDIWRDVMLNQFHDVIPGTFCLASPSNNQARPSSSSTTTPRRSMQSASNRRSGCRKRRSRCCTRARPWQTAMPRKATCLFSTLRVSRATSSSRFPLRSGRQSRPARKRPSRAR